MADAFADGSMGLKPYKIASCDDNGQSPDASDGRVGVRYLKVNQDDPENAKVCGITSEIQALFLKKGGSGLRKTVPTRSAKEEDVSFVTMMSPSLST